MIFSNIRRQFAIQLRGKKKNQIYKEEFYYDFITAFKLLKAETLSSASQLIRLYLKLNIDLKKSDQTIRGTCPMPNSLGKTTSVIFFSKSEENCKLALEAGADKIGSVNDFNDPEKYIFSHQKLYATNDALEILKPYARILGPKGYFPNLKMKTLIEEKDIISSIKSAKRGNFDYKTNKNGVIELNLGNTEFDIQKISENYQ